MSLIVISGCFERFELHRYFCCQNFFQVQKLKNSSKHQNLSCTKYSPLESQGTQEIIKGHQRTQKDLLRNSPGPSKEWKIQEDLFRVQKANVFPLFRKISIPRGARSARAPKNVYFWIAHLLYSLVNCLHHTNSQYHWETLGLPFCIFQPR